MPGSNPAARHYNYHNSNLSYIILSHYHFNDCINICNVFLHRMYLYVTVELTWLPTRKAVEKRWPLIFNKDLFEFQQLLFNIVYLKKNCSAFVFKSQITIIEIQGSNYSLNFKYKYIENIFKLLFIYIQIKIRFFLNGRLFFNVDF